MIFKVLIVFFICSWIHVQGQMVNYQPGCSVATCKNALSWPGSANYAPPGIPICYRLRSSTNETVCAPAGACRLLDRCINGTRCASNLTTCIVDSCCSTPICMPLVLINLCDQSNPPDLPRQTRICSNATWNQNSVSLFNASNYWYSNTIVDFSVDVNGSIYVANGSANHIIKYAAGGLKVVALLGSGSFSPYTFQRMTIDGNGVVYTSEYRTDPSVSATVYRIQRYDTNSSIFGTTILGDSTCAILPNQFCGCTDLFIDRRNLIYCSDAVRHIVITIAPFSPQVTVVAGITNSAGSQLNQLNSPQGIHVDNNGTLFVADSGNNRVLMFLAGNSYGVHLFTTASASPYYYATRGLTVDNSGNVYVSGSSLQRWGPGTTYLTTVLNGSSWGYYYYYYYYASQRIAFDNFGNMILRSYSSSNLDLYYIINNTC